MSRSVARAFGCALIALVLVECGEPTTAPTPVPHESSVPEFNHVAGDPLPHPILAGAGDIANCAVGNDNDGSTARLLDVIFANGQPGNVMMLGEPDETATAANYPGCYVETWGRHLAITRPMPGNKDYINGNIDHYFQYFGAAAGEAPGGYYSFNVGPYWHVVVINSNNSFVPTNTDAAPQVAWLRNDLLLNTKPCIAAFMHHPRFFSSTTPNVSTEAGSLRPVWNELYKHGAEFVASGNRHHYERLKPMRADGTVDLALGVIQFISGTGGTSLGLPQDPPLGSIHPNTEVRGVDYGVIKFTLKPEGYDWQFVPARNRFNDAGSANCHPPTIPVGLLVTSSSPSSVYGQPVTFTAKAEDGTNFVRVGTVSFITGGTCDAPAGVLESGIGLDETGRAKTTVLTLDVPGSPHSITACYTGAGSYQSSTGQIAHTVTKNTGTIAIENLAATYDGQPKIASATTAPADLEVSLTYVDATGAAVSAPIDGGDYTVTATIEDPNYSGSASDVLRIAKATPIIAWANPAPITYGTPLSALQLNATASFNAQPVAGSFTYSPAAGTVLAAGPNQVLTADFTPAAPGNFNSVAGTTVLISVGGATQTIDFANPGDRTFGDPPFAVTATATSGLPVSLSATGACTAAGNLVTIHEAGTCTIAASQPGNENYTAAENVVRSLTVAKAALTVTADDATRTYGAANPVFTGSIAGLVNSDDITATYETAAVDGSLVGTYAITPKLSDPAGNLRNYDVSLRNGALTVTKAALTAQADNKSRAYGEPNPALTGTINGVVGGDPITAEYITEATVESPAGEYVIRPSLVDPGSRLSNYAVTLINGKLTIGKSGQIITFADLPPRTYGDPAFAVGATASSGLPVALAAAGNCSLAGAILTVTSAGSCTVTASQAGNESFGAAADVVRGFAIAKAGLTVRADNKSRGFGEQNPPLTGTVEGVRNGDVIVGSYTTDATPDSPAGEYDIIASVSAAAGVLDNYTVTPVHAKLTIGKASQTITFTQLLDRTFGDPPFSVSATATSNLAVAFAASGNCSIAGGTVTLLAAGGCTITASQPGNESYGAAAEVVRSFSISRATVTITADNKSRAFGEPNPPLTGTVTGFLNGDNVTVTYTTSATLTSPIGEYDIEPNVAPTNGELDNYDVALVRGKLTIGKAAQSITFGELGAKTYGDAAFALDASASSGLAVDFAASGNCAYSNGSVSISGAGSCTVTASQPGNENYGPAADITRSFAIAKAELTVRADNKTRAYGEENPPLTGVLEGVRNGDQITDSYTTNATRESAPGEYDIIASVTAAAGVLDNYQVTSVAGKLSVGSTTQTVIFGELADRTYGDAGFVPNATASSGLPVTFAVSGNCSIGAGGAVELGDSGSCTITASQSGSQSYDAAADVVRSFSINKAPLTVAADDKSRSYGEENPPLTGTLEGVRKGDRISARYITDATRTSPVGEYDILASLDDPDSRLGNYDVTSVNATLRIGTAGQSITFDQLANKTYGDADIALAASASSGLPVSFSVSGSCALSGVSLEITGAGSCDVTASQSGDGSYSAAANVKRSFTIGTASLTVTADDQSRPYGQSNPTLSGSVSGVVNGDNITAEFRTEATATSAVGTYPIVATLNDPGGRLVHYSVEYRNGILTVGKTTQSIEFAQLSNRTYGDPAFAPSATATSGLSVSFAASGACSITGDMVHISAAGTCTITATQAGNTSYEPATDVVRSFSIAKAPLTIVPMNATRSYGDANPPFTGSISGIHNGDAISAVFTTPATPTSVIGSYPIVSTLGDPSGKLANYSVEQPNGMLTVLPAELTVIADDKSRSYGEANPSLTGTLTGVRNNDNITATYSTTATLESDAGTYPITVALNDVDGRLGNYAVTATNGVLTVGRAAQSITFPAPADRTYGDASFGLAAVASSGLPVAYSAGGGCSVSGNIVQVNAAGSCHITASQTGSSKYEPAPAIVVTFNIAQAPLTVTADNKSRAYGETNPALTGTVQGARNGDVLTGAYSTTATTTSAAGEYPITASVDDPNGKLSNYSVTYNHGTLSITPAAIDDPSYSVGEDQRLTSGASVLANDGGGDGISLVAELVEGPLAAATRSFTLNSDGTFSYDPAADFNGSVTFRYRAKVGAGAQSNVATATITVTSVNDAPGFTKGADQVVAEDAGAQSVSGWATTIRSGPSNEGAQGVTFEVTANTNPALFAVAPAVSPAGTLTYTPTPNAHGTAIITVLVRDNGGIAAGGIDASAPQTFNVTVQSVNDAPMSAGDTYTADEDRRLTVAAAGVLANDTDPDGGDVLRAVLANGPSNGALVLNPDGSFTYTPNLHFSGTDGFTYRASDGVGTSGEASVTLTVKPRATAKLDIIPGSSTNSVGYNSSQPEIVFAILSSPTLDATLVEPTSVTLGNDSGTDTPLALNANGTPKFMLVDVNGDGRRDFYAYVNKAQMKQNGDLTPTTTSLTSLWGMKAPTTQLYRGKDAVHVVQ